LFHPETANKISYFLVNNKLDLEIPKTQNKLTCVS